MVMDHNANTQREDRQTNGERHLRILLGDQQNANLRRLTERQRGTRLGNFMDHRLRALLR